MTKKEKTACLNTEIHSRQQLFSKVDRKALNIVCAAFTGLKHKSSIYTSSQVKENELGAFFYEKALQALVKYYWLSNNVRSQNAMFLTPNLV